MKKISIFILLVFLTISCWGQVKVTMEKHGNVYYIPGKVNGLSMKFIFDTGASEVSLSLAEAVFMLKNGYLKESELGDKVYSQIANGDVVENTKVILRNIEIEGINISNVSALISNTLDAPLLLGQSAIQKLGPIQLNGNILTIANGQNIPSEELAKKLYGQVYQQVESKEYDKAINNALEAIKNTSSSKLRAALYDNLGIAYYQIGEKDKAIESFNHALEENTYLISARYNLGFYSYEMGLYEQALRAFQLVTSNPGNQDIECLSASYGYIGDIYERLGRYKEGEEAFLKSIQIQPNSFAYLGLADFYRMKKNFDKASEYYEKGIEYEPDRLSNIKRYHQLGMCLYYANKKEEAFKAFNQCMETTFLYKDAIDKILESSNDEGLKNKMKLFMVLSFDAELWTARTAPDATEVIRRYNHIISDSMQKEEMTSNDYYTFAMAYSYLNDTEKAINILDLGLQQFKDDPELAFAKARCLPDGSKESIDIYRWIVEKEYQYSPKTFDYGTVYNNIAWGYCILQKYNEGLTYSLKAVQKNPEHGYSWETLGELYFNLGKYQDCIDAMTKCISCNDSTQYKSAYEIRGKSYLKLGKIKESKADFNKVKDM